MENSFFVLALSILGSSILGSWHCAAMCGPIAAARRQRPLAYHAGRGFAYVVLGALSAWIGEKIFLHTPYTVRIAFAVIVGAFILMGIFGRGRIHWPYPSWLPRALTSSSHFVSGAAAVFLPCGWLWTFLSAATATGSAPQGAFVMFLFWLGGLPALSAFQLYFNATLRHAPGRLQVWSSRVVGAASLYALFAHFLTL